MNQEALTSGATIKGNYIAPFSVAEVCDECGATYDDLAHAEHAIWCARGLDESKEDESAEEDK